MPFLVHESGPIIIINYYKHLIMTKQEMFSFYSHWKIIH